jgi:hypothetical protein
MLFPQVKEVPGDRMPKESTINYEKPFFAHLLVLAWKQRRFFVLVSSGPLSGAWS